MHKKGVQPFKQKQNLDWDFVLSGNPPISPPLPIFKNDNPIETPIECFERFQRQLCRTISACSLCSKGLKDHTYKHIIRDPHYSPSIQHKDIVLIKMEPTDADIYGLFDYVKPIIEKYNLNFKDFYLTTINKCPSHEQTSIKCPYWILESKALKPVWPKLWIILDSKSSNKLGLDYDLGKFTNFKNKQKAFCTAFDHKSFKTILKLIANPQSRKRLFLS